MSIIRQMTNLLNNRNPHRHIYLIILSFITTQTQQTYSESCTNYESDTCIIDRLHEWDSTFNQSIECSQDPLYPNCIINCNNEQFSCGTNQDDVVLFPNIHCPLNGNQCTINCLYNKSCSGTIIQSNNCSNLNIIIHESDMDRLQIYAPGNDGTLNITLTNHQSLLQESMIYTQSTTSNVIIDCNQGDQCNTLHIDGSTMSNEARLKFLCNGTNIQCMDNVIKCPLHRNNIDMTPSCNIECGGECDKLTVFAMEGINDIDWKCNDYDLNACNDSYLLCGIDFRQQSEWQYVNEKWSLSGNCSTQYDDSSIFSNIPTTITTTTETTKNSPTISTVDHQQRGTSRNYGAGLIIGLAVGFFVLICCLLCCTMWWLLMSWKESSKDINQAERQIALATSQKNSTNTTSTTTTTTTTLQSAPLPNDLSNNNSNNNNPGNNNNMLLPLQPFGNDSVNKMRQKRLSGDVIKMEMGMIEEEPEEPEEEKDPDIDDIIILTEIWKNEDPESKQSDTEQRESMHEEEKEEMEEMDVKEEKEDSDTNQTMKSIHVRETGEDLDYTSTSDGTDDDDDDEDDDECP